MRRVQLAKIRTLLCYVIHTVPIFLSDVLYRFILLQQFYPCHYGLEERGNLSSHNEAKVSCSTVRLLVCVDVPIRMQT